MEITSNLLDKVSTKLSSTKQESKIYAMPDLGIAQNGTRMLGGFYTGACYSWNSDIPFVPVDTTVNVCGTTVYRLNQKITPQEFQERLDNVMKRRETYTEYVKTHLPSHIIEAIDLNDESKFFWNYNVGNHFVILADYRENNSNFPTGQYMIVHASAIELKKDNMSYGLYPVKGNWYYDDIKTEFDENENRYLRYIYGEKAIRFYNLADILQQINKDRNRYFCEKVLGELAHGEVINISHYGMPTNNSVCIGCQWEQEDYTLLTAPGNDVFLVHPDLSSTNSINIDNRSLTLTPHGCGVSLKNNDDTISYLDDGIEIGNKHFKIGESINIGDDVLVRTKNMDKKHLNQHIQSILNKCPGRVYGRLHQLYARTKYGDFDYTTKDIELK